MLDRNARKVLKFFIKNDANQSWSSIAFKLNLTKSKNTDIDFIHKAIEDLLELELIKPVGYNSEKVYKLTNKGKMYFKNSRYDWIKSVLNGILFPIIVALITSLVTTLTTIYLSKYQNNTKKLIFHLDVIAFLLSILMIWSGNSIVGLMFLILAMLYQKIVKKNLTIKNSMYILAFLFVFIIFFQGFKLFSDFIVEVLGKDLTLSGRTSIWSNGIKEWLKYPLLGHGFQISEAFITFANVSDYVRGAHNQILNILLHGGIIYLILFVIVFCIIHNVTKKYKNNE